MPTSTFIPLATTTLAGGETSVTFGSIPAYRDYRIVVDVTSSSNSVIMLRLGSSGTLDTGSNYSYVWATGNGSTTASSTATNAELRPYIGGYTSRQIWMDIMDGSATDKHKTILTRGDGEEVNMFAGRWASTNAIDIMEIRTSINSWTSGTISLYGIAS